MKKEKNNYGFTLVELMVAIMLLGIVVTLAIPFSSDIIKNNRMTSSINSLQGELTYAKGEAMTTGKSIVLCVSNAAGNSCDNSRNWEDGWVVFRDEDQNGSFNDDGDTNLCEDGEDCILKVRQNLPSGQTLTYTGTNTKLLAFSSLGFVNDTGIFKLCDDRGVEQASGIQVLKTSLRRMRDTNNNGTVDVAGTEITCP